MLRRVLGIKADGDHAESTQNGKEPEKMQLQKRRTYSRRIMTPTFKAGPPPVFEVTFDRGPTESWTLPPASDVAAFRQVLARIVDWANGEDASQGQIGYIRKELNDHGYYIQGPR